MVAGVCRQLQGFDAEQARQRRIHDAGIAAYFEHISASAGADAQLCAQLRIGSFDQVVTAAGRDHIVVDAIVIGTHRHGVVATASVHHAATRSERDDIVACAGSDCQRIGKATGVDRHRIGGTRATGVNGGQSRARRCARHGHTLGVVRSVGCQLEYFDTGELRQVGIDYAGVGGDLQTVGATTSINSQIAAQLRVVTLHHIGAIAGGNHIVLHTIVGRTDGDGIGAVTGVHHTAATTQGDDIVACSGVDAQCVVETRGIDSDDIAGPGSSRIDAQQTGAGCGGCKREVLRIVGGIARQFKNLDTRKQREIAIADISVVGDLKGVAAAARIRQQMRRQLRITALDQIIAAAGRDSVIEGTVVSGADRHHIGTVTELRKAAAGAEKHDVVAGATADGQRIAEAAGINADDIIGADRSRIYATECAAGGSAADDHALRVVDGVRAKLKDLDTGNLSEVAIRDCSVVGHLQGVRTAAGGDGEIAAQLCIGEVDEIVTRAAADVVILHPVVGRTDGDGVVALTRCNHTAAAAEQDDVGASASMHTQGIAEARSVDRHRVSGAGGRGIHRGDPCRHRIGSQGHALGVVAGIGRELQGFDTQQLRQVGIGHRGVGGHFQGIAAGARAHTQMTAQLRVAGLDEVGTAGGRDRVIEHTVVGGAHRHGVGTGPGIQHAATRSQDDDIGAACRVDRQRTGKAARIKDDGIRGAHRGGIKSVETGVDRITGKRHAVVVVCRIGSQGQGFHAGDEGEIAVDYGGVGVDTQAVLAGIGGNAQVGGELSAAETNDVSAAAGGNGVIPHTIVDRTDEDLVGTITGIYHRATRAQRDNIIRSAGIDEQGVGEGSCVNADLVVSANCGQIHGHETHRHGVGSEFDTLCVVNRVGRQLEQLDTGQAGEISIGDCSITGDFQRIVAATRIDTQSSGQLTIASLDQIGAGAGRDVVILRTVIGRPHRHGVGTIASVQHAATAAEHDAVIAGAGTDRQGIVKSTGVDADRIVSACRQRVDGGDTGGLGIGRQSDTLCVVTRVSRELEDLKPTELREIGIRYRSIVRQLQGIAATAGGNAQITCQLSIGGLDQIHAAASRDRVVLRTVIGRAHRHGVRAIAGMHHAAAATECDDVITRRGGDGQCVREPVRIDRDRIGTDQTRVDGIQTGCCRVGGQDHTLGVVCRIDQQLQDFDAADLREIGIDYRRVCAYRQSVCQRMGAPVDDQCGAEQGVTDLDEIITAGTRHLLISRTDSDRVGACRARDAETAERIGSEIRGHRQAHILDTDRRHAHTERTAAQHVQGVASRRVATGIDVAVDGGSSHVDDVVAGTSLDGGVGDRRQGHVIVAAAGDDKPAAGGGGDVKVIGGGARGQVFKILVAASFGCDLIGAVGEIDGHRATGGVDGQRVIASAGVDRHAHIGQCLVSKAVVVSIEVDAVADTERAADGIAAGASVDGVGARTQGDRVIVGAAEYGIGAVAKIDGHRLRGGTGIEIVVTAASYHGGSTRVGGDVVIARAAVQADATGQRVVARAGLDEAGVRSGDRDQRRGRS